VIVELKATSKQMPFQHVSSVKSFEIIASLVVFVFCLGNTLSWPYSLVILNPQGPGTAYVTCIYCFLFCSVSACVIYFSFFSFTKCRVIEHHVDGFRCDLASVLCRGTNGSPLDAPPLVWVRGFCPSEFIFVRSELIAFQFAWKTRIFKRA
jgi:hypothetical protein